MAEGSKVNEVHIKHLANLCRICGNRLKKLKEIYQTTYSCKDHRDFLEKKFHINTEKDDPSIHPPRFVICAIALTQGRDSTGKFIRMKTAALVEKRTRQKRGVDQENREEEEENTSLNNQVIKL